MEDPNDLYDAFEEHATEIYNSVKELQKYLEKYKLHFGPFQYLEATRILERFSEDLEEDLYLIF